jgi:hypothetical protein
VLCVKVPETAAVVPDAEFVKEKLADPEPPATALSSSSVSSITISILSSPDAGWLCVSEDTKPLKFCADPKPRSASVTITQRGNNPF